MVSLPEATDVLVVGGGMVGSAAAYFLSRAGLSVVLCERGNLCSEATGKQGGMVTQIDGRDLNVGLNSVKLSYTRESNKIYDILQDELQFDFQYRRRGGLDIAFQDDEFEHLSKLYHIQKQNGDDEIQLLDEKELRSLCPAISPLAKGARYRASDANISTFMFVYALITGAKEYGAKVFTHTKVKEICFNNHNEVVGVNTEKGYIRTDWVFNAGGAWAGDLTSELDIVPVCSTAAISEPIPPVHIQTFEAELEGKVVYGGTQTARGNLLFGASLLDPRRREDHYNNSLSLGDVRYTASVISRIFPELSNVNILRAWGGTMGWSADNLPYVGQVPGKKGLIVAAAFPNGGAYAPILTKLACEIICKGQPSLPLDLFDIGRFSRRMDWPEVYDYSILGDFLANEQNVKQS